MKLAKILLILLVLSAFGIVFLILPSEKETITTNQPTQSRAAPSRGDDPTYAEEVKQLTALTRSTNEKARIQEEEYTRKIRNLEEQIQDAKRANQLAPKDNQRLLELENQINDLGQSFQQTLEQSLNPIKSTVAKLSNQQQASGNHYQSNFDGYVKIMPLGGTPSVNVNDSFFDASSLVPDISNSNELNTQSNSNTPENIPVYTLPDTSILSDTITLTPLIGRVPNGGNVNDPFRFRLITGADNLMANGHRVPGVKKAFWSGYAIGVREESCVRGYIDTVTFIFEDGRIYTQKSGNAVPTQSTRLNESLGYIADAGGNQCLTGMLVSNASAYLRDRSVAAFAEGLATAYADSQTTVDRTGNGSLSAFVDGDTIKFGLGRGISQSASEVASYLRQRQDNAFDVVYFPNNKRIQIMVEQSINIDYNPSGRKVSYDYADNIKSDSIINLD